MGFKLSVATISGSFLVALNIGIQNLLAGAIILILGFASGVILYYKK